jgi:hypothetical protein
MIRLIFIFFAENSCGVEEFWNPEVRVDLYHSYETTPSWNSEPQNIEQEISNDEVWNRLAQSFFNNNE